MKKSTDRSNVTRNLMWLAVGLFGTLTLIAVIAWVVLSTSLVHSVASAPTPSLIPATVKSATATPTARPSSTPDPTVTPVPPQATATPPSTIIHVVEPGDTLYDLARQYGVTEDAIQRANDIADPSALKVGERLIIPLNSPPSGSVLTPTAQPGSKDQPFTPATLYACPANAVARPLTLPADPIELAISADQAYLVADGDLYAVPLAELSGEGPLSPANVTPSERKIGNYTIRELVHAAVDPDSGDLVLLDKSGDIYRRTVGGEWRMEIAVAPIPGQYPDPQYLAIQVFGGNVYALDADLGRIWKFTPGATLPVPYYFGSDVETGMDMVIPSSGPGNGAVFVLTRAGQVIKFLSGRRDRTLSLSAEAGRVAWPAQILAAGERIVLVDSDNRRITALDAANGSVAWQATFRFPNMQRLRSAAIAGDTLYALGGRTLYAARLSSLDGNCSPVTYDDALYFNGADIRALMPNYKLPFPGVTLPMRPRSYPGARRLYRFGVHYGVDLYPTDVAGLAVGSPVWAIADGTVIRADTDYQEMTPQEYDAAEARAKAEHQTPPDLFDKFLGRQVRLSHPGNVESRYAHLSAIAPGVSPNAPIKQGKPVGNVGVSGTNSGAYGSEEGAHLHVEIWINGRYLGQGLSLNETMRLWQAVFE
jgi:murein DD-endopeptidase MepM/ murein hydrolase activator NlpD